MRRVLLFLCSFVVYCMFTCTISISFNTIFDAPYLYLSLMVFDGDGILLFFFIMYCNPPYRKTFRFDFALILLR